MVNQNITLSEIKFRASLLWSQFTSDVNLKPSILLLIFLGICFSLPAQATPFNETFDTDPTGGNGTHVSTFSITHDSTQFDFTYTTDGGSGGFVHETVSGGDAGPNSIIAESFGGAGEKITIIRNDMQDFTFTSIFINNFGDSITVGGYKEGSLVGSTQMATSSSVTLNFGGIVVDEVRLTSTNFAANIDSFSGDTSTSTPNTTPTGSVTIGGTASEGQTLTASNTLADADVLGAITYQWSRSIGGVPSDVATGETYLLTQADVGSTITVTANYTDGGMTAESEPSAATAVVTAVTNVNNPVTGTVTIDNLTPAEGDTLMVSDDLADLDGLGTFVYQWKSGGANVGMNATTYTTTQADVGNAITVTISYTDGFLNPESEVSAATANVTNVNNPVTGTVTINNLTPAEGDTLTASDNLADMDGLGTFSYQWKRGAIDVGTNADTYVLSQVDVGSQITVTISYTDDGGTGESVSSAATSTITDINNAPTGSVSITGTAAEGQTLTASNNLADADNIVGGIAYQWQRNNNDILGAIGTTYVLAQGDVGAIVRVVARYTDGGGLTETVPSPATATITDINNPPTGSVSITGTAAEGRTLMASNNLADADNIVGGIAYQWQRNNSNISGETGTTYVLAQGDVGATIRVVASYTDAGGLTETVPSLATATITDINNAPTGSVSITGTATEGQTLTASNNLADADNIVGGIAYQWQRNNSNISGETGTAYVLAQGDVGATIRVVASYTDGGGLTETVPSPATATITDINNAPTGSVSITGTATEGQTLTASNNLADADNIVGGIAYQWKRGVNDILGATGTTYVLVQSDVGENITVTAKYTDGGGLQENITSVGTAKVANVNDAPTGSVNIDNLTPAEGDTLAISNTLADEDNLGDFSFQWNRDGSPIVGATLETYLLVQADVGKAITATISYTDAGNTAESVTSAATILVANINEVGSVAINGVLAVGQTLEANITDADGTDNLVLDPVNYPVTYQWKRDGNDIAGATFKEYTLVSADLASAITVVVTYVDDQNTTENLTSSSMVTVKDETPPVITVPNDITVTAAGVFTKIDIGVATAVDNIDGELIPISNAPDQFKPGITTVMWQVEDAAGNPMVGLQIITVKPLVDFSVDKVAAENTGVNGTSFSIFLNGKVSYDIKVPYTISGTADGIDHDLMNGFAIIVSERDVAEVPFTIHEDLDLEGMENIVITMGEPTPDAAIGIKSTLTINISEQNIAPVVSLSANQAAIQTRTIAVGSGAVTVSSDASDPNTNDKLTYDWSATDNALFDIDAADGVFTFNPFGLEGSYVLRLSVSDGFSISKTELLLNIFTDAPAPELIVDSDNDGIPDVFDSGDKTNILPSRTGLFTSGLLETEAGLVFGLGDIAFMAGKGQAKVSMADISNDGKPADVGFAYPSDLFDFDIEGLGAAGQSIDIVLPQQLAIPANATYRKLVANNWQEFVIDDNNAIASALGASGFCPPPGDAQYQAGLTEGHFCVQLTIEDGGANDGDGVANNRISDPSGVAITAAVSKPPGSDNSNGIFGLGSLNLWWLSLFALFGLRGYCIRTK